MKKKQEASIKQSIPLDKKELAGFVKGLELALKVWEHGTQTYAELSQYIGEAKIKLQK